MVLCVHLIRWPVGDVSAGRPAVSMGARSAAKRGGWALYRWKREAEEYESLKREED